MIAYLAKCLESRLVSISATAKSLVPLVSIVRYRQVSRVVNMRAPILLLSLAVTKTMKTMVTSSFTPAMVATILTQVSRLPIRSLWPETLRSR